MHKLHCTLPDIPSQTCRLGENKTLLSTIELTMERRHEYSSKLVDPQLPQDDHAEMYLVTSNSLRKKS